MFCLVKSLAEKFTEKLRSGEIDPEKLSSMSSTERRDFFSKFLGEENAKQVNALFESKLLLKNQKEGIINWAKQVAGMKPEAMRDILSKVNKMTEILNPENEKAFLHDLTAKKLGTEVTVDEAAKISELGKRTNDLKLKINEKSPIGSEDRMAYGRALVAFGDYISDLKNEGKKLSLKEGLNPKNYAKVISRVAGLAKSLKATLDNSVIGRQGLKVLFSNPKIWLENSKQSFVDIVQSFGGKEVLNEVRADVYSRPNALNGLYKKEGLAIGNIEEAYPTSLPEKIPVAGRVFKASESAFTAFQYRTRADVFDKYVNIAKKTGADIEGIGKVANSLTGRGTFGQRLEGAASALNNVFFSPRLLKSNIDLLTAHAFDKDIGEFARKQAAMNMIKVIGGVATIMAIANAIKPGSAETDPRSADFGKIKIGDTRFDYTGGIASLVTLASRLLTLSSKSSITGKVSSLNSGAYGGQTGVDVFTNFGENKLSPVASVIKDLLQGQDFQGNKITLGGEINNLLTPLPITTYQELSSNPNSANVLLSMIADGLGINTNTYSNTVNWNQSNTKELTQFKEKVGQDKFKKANNLYNTTYNEWLKKVETNPEYEKLPPAIQQKVQTNKKAEIKKDVLLKYGFRYKAPAAKKTPKF